MQLLSAHTPQTTGQITEKQWMIGHKGKDTKENIKHTQTHVYVKNKGV